MLAKDPEKNAKESFAAVVAVFDVFLNKAKEESVPVYLETALEESKKEYEELGFKVAEEVVIGKGRVDSTGWPKEGGEGVRTWALLYDQHLN